jgi:homoserine kinase type II
MSVFTPVSERELARWLKRYAVDAPLALEPIAAGIENTNYFVTTAAGRFVLTLFERLPASQLPFYLGLMAHLARHGIPCPAPLADLDNRYFSELNGKPAALVTRLAGCSVEAPQARHCAAIGALLARMHLAGRSYDGYLENPRGMQWWRSAAAELRPRLDAEDQRLLDEELRFQSLHRLADLPRGPVHADLFRDNALFEGERLTGVIDFYFAGVDCLLYDVAVCVNDWCLADPRRDPRLDERRTRALLDAYRELRPLGAAEREAWPVLLRAAALRFWLSRLFDYHLPRPGKLVRVHDPRHFRRVLVARIQAAAPEWGA